MSSPFSDFAQLNVQNQNNAFTLGLGGPLTISQPLGVQQITIPRTILAFQTLAVNLGELVSRWWFNYEAGRRSIVDVFLRLVLQRQDHATLGIYPEYRITPNMFNNQIGHGPLDYLISTQGMAPLVRFYNLLNQNVLNQPPFPAVTNPDLLQSFVVEAKRDLQTQAQEGELQLAAQLATLWQQMNRNAGNQAVYFKGILTDGRFWTFYQFNANLRSLQKTQRFDAATLRQPPQPPQQMPQTQTIMRLIHRFASVPNTTSAW